MCACVRTYARTRVRTYVHRHARTYVRTYTHACTYVRTHAHICPCTYVLTYARACTYVHLRWPSLSGICVALWRPCDWSQRSHFSAYRSVRTYVGEDVGSAWRQLWHPCKFARTRVDTYSRKVRAYVSGSSRARYLRKGRMQRCIW